MSIEFCQINSLPIVPILHNREHINCVQTVLLKIYLGLPVPIYEDITDYTPIDEIHDKLKQLKKEKSNE